MTIDTKQSREVLSRFVFGCFMIAGMIVMAPGIRWIPDSSSSVQVFVSLVFLWEQSLVSSHVGVPSRIVCNS